MIRQVKDRFYEEVVNEPSREKFREFIKNNVGELDEVDFKEQWISKGELSKLLLAMANSRGGVIVIGIKENDDGTLEPIGLEELKDKADINNEVAKYISPALDYEVFDFVYNAAEYAALNGKKFQMVHVHDTPDRLPFFSLNETNGLGKNEVYIRRGTKCEKATAEEIERIIDTKIGSIIFYVGLPMPHYKLPIPSASLDMNLWQCFRVFTPTATNSGTACFLSVGFRHRSIA